MAVSAGQRLLHYRLVEKIGEGAMGRVWRAEDTTLDRDVAIKLLPEAFGADPGRLDRFAREAKILASLNHPGIAAVYGLHESEGLRFLAMELVPGETLADRLECARPSALPLDETLGIVRQIAEALEAAHDGGVVHRDLKPANVMLRPDGRIKVLDFGLARAVPEGAADAEAQTETFQTELGSVLGTALYMSPEQARGRPVDKRADIWALGCVLFECLVGKQPFAGETTADVIAAVLSQAPDLDALPGATPPLLRRTIRRCLEKEPRRRLRDAGEVRLDIEEVESAGHTAGGPQGRARAGRAIWARPAPAWAVAAVLAAALLWVTANGQAPEPSEMLGASEWAIRLPAGERILVPGPGGKFDYSRQLAISRDGSRIVYAAQSPAGETRLFLRETGSIAARPIPETGEARAPFFSPDGEWIGFYAGAALHRIALSGGSPQKLCDVGRMISIDGTWSPDGRTIVYATDEGLWRVSADGGDPVRLTQPDTERGEAGHHLPRFTAGGEGILFTVTVTPRTDLAYLALADGKWRTIVEEAAQGLPLPGGRIVFARSGELLVAGFDTRRARLLSSPRAVREGVETTPGLAGIVVTQFDVSDTGTLIYAPAAEPTSLDRLLWVGRDGSESEITRGAGTWVHPRLSPDGERISVDIHSPDGMRDVYVYELARGQLNRLTDSGVTWESEWRPPDGRRIATLSGAPPGQWSLFWAATDFSGPPELLYRTGHAVPLPWHPDGESFFFTKHRYDGGLWRLWVDRPQEPELVLSTAARERFVDISRDGRWITYVADESGRGEVFVRSFPELGPRTKVTIDGGGEPRFAHSGRELFYRLGDGMYRVELTQEPEIRVGPPELLFTGEYDDAPSGHQHYDIARGDRRFLMIRHGEASGPSEVRVVLNWVAGPGEASR